MFSTFVGVPHTRKRNDTNVSNQSKPDSSDRPKGPGSGAGSGNINVTAKARASASSNARNARRQRGHVARACDACRLNRTKCDNDTPCHSCASRRTACRRGSAEQLHNPYPYHPPNPPNPSNPPAPAPAAAAASKSARNSYSNNTHTHINEHGRSSSCRTRSGTECDDRDRDRDVDREIESLHAKIRDLSRGIGIGVGQRDAHRPSAASTTTCTSNNTPPPRYQSAADAAATTTTTQPPTDSSSLSSSPSPNHGDADACHRRPSLLDVWGAAAPNVDLSTPSFINRFRSFASNVLHQPLPPDMTRPRPPKVASSSSSLASPAPSAPFCVRHAGPESTASARCSTLNLTRPQQEYFLGLYWQHCHSIIPLLHEASFKDHFDSLWPSLPNTPDRLPCPLTDILLAIGMQYSTNFQTQHPGLLHPSPNSPTPFDASSIGRCYSQRCQEAITNHLEDPSLLTLQCAVLLAVYLTNASLTNTAFYWKTLAIRIAHALETSQSPSDSISLVEQELRGRIYWLLYILDFRKCIESGQPCTMIQPRDKQYPSDSLEVAQLFGADASSVNHVTSLTFFSQLCRHSDAARTVYTTYGDDIVEHASLDRATAAAERKVNPDQDLESRATLFANALQPLLTWVDNVPTGLKMRRRRGGRSFSTDGTSIDLERGLATWLQQHRLALELNHHRTVANMCRAFLTFDSKQSQTNAKVKIHAEFCVNHAMTIVNIVYQVLTESDLLIPDACELLWDATLSLLGFVFARGADSLASTALANLDTAIASFDMLGSRFGAAVRASVLASEYKASALQWAKQFHGANETIPDGGPPSRWPQTQQSTSDDSNIFSGDHFDFSLDTWNSGDVSLEGNNSYLLSSTKSDSAQFPSADLDDIFMLDINNADPSGLKIPDEWLETTNQDFSSESNILQQPLNF